MNFIENYKKNIPLYQDFVNEVIFTISEETKQVGLKYADLKGRVKTVESIEEKIERHKIRNPNEQIYDYAGVRIVCLFEEEKESFANLIKKVFKVTWEDNKKEKLGSKEMGYQSLHFSVNFDDKYSGPRYNKFQDLVCEVQITTVLLEAWALINHTISYKNESAIPINIQRDMNNVSSLLEVAQKVFDDSFDKRKKYLSEIEKTTKNKDTFLSQPIDFDTLTMYSKTYFPDLEISEHWQNRLIEDIDKNKFKTLNDINNAVINAKDFVQYYEKVKPVFFMSSTDILTKSLGYSDVNFRDKHAFAEVTIKAFERFESKKYAS